MYTFSYNIKTMKPFEQFWYKQSWKPGYVVKLHTDLQLEGKTWCKENIQAHRWYIEKHTESYYHSYHFELEKSALDFYNKWPEYSKKENF